MKILKTLLHIIFTLTSIAMVVFVFFAFFYISKSRVSFKCQIPKDMKIETIEVHEDAVILESSNGFIIFTDSCVFNELGYHRD